MTAGSLLKMYLLAAVCIAAVGGLDFMTGTNVRFLFFNLLVIVAFTYTHGLFAAIPLSIACALVWLVIQLSIGVENDIAINAWNTLLRLLTFFLTSTFFYYLLKMRRLYRLQRDMTNFVIHDLRSPLTGMMLGLDALDDKLRGPLNTEQHDIVLRLRTQGHQLSNFIDTLLTYTQVERTSLEVQETSIDVQWILQEAQRQLLDLMRQKSLNFKNDISPPDATCIADRDLLMRVLVNVYSNAIKASPSGSSITSRTIHRQEDILFSISDMGPGVSPDEMKRIMPADEKVGLRAGGGFGIRFCRIAIKANGGSLWLESEEGKGTRVCFTLPAVLTLARGDKRGTAHQEK